MNERNEGTKIANIAKRCQIHVITATTGIDQGDPLSAALFMIGLQTVIQSIKLQDDTTPYLAAYADDIYIPTPNTQIQYMLEHTKQLLAKIDLKTNMLKTQLYRAPQHRTTP